MTQQDRLIAHLADILADGPVSRGRIAMRLTRSHRPLLRDTLALLSRRGWIDLGMQVTWTGPNLDYTPEWGERDSYRAVHLRLRAQRGRASDLQCPCGAPATNWSYDGGDPDERYGIVKTGLATKRRYSIDLSRYTARCYSCHARLDRSGPA